MPKPKKISPDQRSILAFRESGLSFDEIDKKLNYVRRGQSRDAFYEALATLSPADIAMQYPDLEVAKEIQQAQKLVEGTALDPHALLNACSASGIPVKQLKLVAKRMRARLVPESSYEEEYRTDTIVERLGATAMEALTWMDSYAMSTASVKELATVVDIMVKNKQLLEGQPTQIIDVNDRRQLQELLPYLQREASRRAIDVSPAAILESDSE